MPEYVLDLDDTVEDLYFAIETIQEGYNGHKLVFTGETEEKAAAKICMNLVGFFAEKLKRK